MCYLCYVLNKFNTSAQLKCFLLQDAETRARVDQRLYFDMGGFYKVNVEFILFFIVYFTFYDTLF